MSFVHIPEKQIDSHSYNAPTPKEGDFLELLLEKLPLLKTVSIAEILGLLLLIEESLKDRSLENGHVPGLLSEELITVLNEFERDPGHASTLLQENQLLRPEVLPKALFVEARGADGKGLSSKIAEWQTQCKEGSLAYLFAQKLLDAIRSQENGLQDHPTARSAEPVAQALLAAVKDGGEARHSLLVQVYEKAIAYSNSPSASVETKQFLQTILLPQIEKWIAQDSHLEKRAGENQTPTPHAPLLESPLSGEEKLKQENPIQSLFEPLLTSDGQKENVLKEIPNAGAFPVLAPYPTNFAPSHRVMRRRRRYPRRREEYPEDEEPDQDQPPSDSSK